MPIKSRAELLATIDGPVASERDTVTQPPLPLPKRGGKVKKGRRTQRPSSGEPRQPTAILSPRVEVRRSSRRTRTVTAYRERDTIVVLIPQRMSKADEQTFVKDMVERVLAREARTSAPQGDDALAARARELAAVALGASSGPHARADLRFVGDQSATALGLMHAQHRRHQTVPPPPALASVGR